MISVPVSLHGFWTLFLYVLLSYLTIWIGGLLTIWFTRDKNDKELLRATFKRLFIFAPLGVWIAPFSIFLMNFCENFQVVKLFKASMDFIYGKKNNNVTFSIKE
jgi:hypothetical protein